MKKSLLSSLFKGRNKNKKRVLVSMSPHESLRDYAGQAGGIDKKRVVVAMSGGVDSSVAAALLKEQGYDVVGVFMRFWHEAQSKENTCCSEGAEQAARNVAQKLGIPFYVLSVQKEFKKAVVDYFLNESKRGHTPNPCVACNKKIKFGLLFEKAMAMGADFVATGHYARVEKIKNQKSKVKNTNQNSKVFKLYKAEDKDKDQSYFLYNLTQKQLGRVLFPLGDYTKSQVYQMAKKWGLPYRKEESFDLCFVAKDAESFLKRYLRMKEGKIIKYDKKVALRENPPQPSLKGRSQNSPPLGGVRGDFKILGRHQGLPLYTIGQRKNLSLSQGPWWVINKDEQRNILYVSNNEEDLYSRELVVKNINWLIGVWPGLPLKVWAKIRYKSETSPAVVRGIAMPRSCGARNDIVKVMFQKSQRAMTAGQSVVFYRKDGEILGGGVIN